MAQPQDFFGYTFAVENEDHTLANTLRFFLNKNPNVSFCGYSMPHPSEEVVNIRVQTTGDVPAARALRTACEELKEVTQHIKSEFLAELERFESAMEEDSPSKDE
mmetsp:Transcript_14761/g.25706  ORF Transcript_14761/g.25706 Transcript_14761/m.25706 type:complete len:105 (-) Transcript_14761:1336-1650(-)|eukprot:CAMPEP_0119103066 /NCGR_PEP_ID=MMETSP1180-20130426/1604_1 /TAXON_ID=3052 ORGANISM="Chlamydomonas cf sp, Strain CCMP681" /NCGR_SAMPLE_ID=MMETSP1180 /ASSEMBLY_ACC=CAM_ASM_000741 /LENGTH=104 /DNA_ID=CAMNT_0007087485 /DNA_START=103 /DNA_END=417 /DNA_ORIENTATION=+